jgi:hypothetical protein
VGLCVFYGTLSSYFHDVIGAIGQDETLERLWSCGLSSKKKKKKKKGILPHEGWQIIELATST